MQRAISRPYIKNALPIAPLILCPFALVSRRAIAHILAGERAANRAHKSFAVRGPREFLRPPPGASPHFQPPRGISKEFQELLRERFDLAGWNQESFHAIAHDRSRLRSRDDRQARSERFVRHQRRALVQGREHEHVGPAIALG